jgi:hypothetical protein
MALFKVGFWPYQWRLLIGIGLVPVGIGVSLPVRSLAASHSVTGDLLLVSGAVTLCGLAFWWWAWMLRRSAILCFGSELLVRPMLGRPRMVLPEEIMRIVPLADKSGGLKALSASPGRRVLFKGSSLWQDYDQLLDWIRQSRPDLVIPAAALPPR